MHQCLQVVDSRTGKPYTIPIYDGEYIRTATSNPNGYTSEANVCSDCHGRSSNTAAKCGGRDFRIPVCSSTRTDDCSKIPIHLIAGVIQTPTL